MRRQNFNKPHRISHIFPSARGPNRRLFQSLNKKPPCYLRAPYLFSFFLGVAPSNPKHCKWPLDMAILAGGKVCRQREDGDLLHTLWSEGGIGWRLSCLEFKRLGGRKIILVPSFIISHPKMTMQILNRPNAYCACHNCCCRECEALRCLRYQWILDKAVCQLS